MSDVRRPLELLLATMAHMLNQPKIRVAADSAAVGLVSRASNPDTQLPALIVRKGDADLVLVLEDESSVHEMIASILHARGTTFQANLETEIAGIRKEYDALVPSLDTDTPKGERDVPPAFSIEGNEEDNYLRISPIVLSTEDEIEDYLDKLTEVVNRLYDIREATAKTAREQRQRRPRPDKD